MVVSQSGGQTLLWFTSYSSVLGVEAQNSVWCIQDNGTSLAIAKNFYSLSAGVNPGFDRVKVDRRTESVFIQDSWAGISKVDNWFNPRVLACSTSANKVLNGPDFNISPDGLLWVREGTSYSGPITRYTMAHKHAPLNFASTGNNWLTPYVYSRYGQGYGERGFAIRKDGYVACTYMYDWAVYHVGGYGPAASPDTVKSGNEIIHPMPGACGGVEFDPAGNLYVGASIRSPGHVVPSGFASDDGYLCGVGAVVKYARGATGSISDGGAVASRTATGAMRIYKPGFAPLSSNGPMYECACRNPRFDVDDYGRLFIPNSITQQVTVVDNDDNEILHFGQWGNTDNRGNGSGPAIPLAWPVGAAASDDFIYVTDMVNCRLLRIKMNFVLDNIPGIAQSAALKAAPGTTPLSLTASPNPFSPVSRIRVGVPSSQTVRLDVFDANGRLLRTLSKGTLRAGYTDFAWNGTDGYNRPVAPGLYVYRLTAGGKVLNLKTILAK
jgi:hypothetical protein